MLQEVIMKSVGKTGRPLSPSFGNDSGQLDFSERNYPAVFKYR